MMSRPLSERPRLRVYNTRTRTVVPFVPLDGDHVRIYVCGLTPSAEAHLGHARSFMFFDVVRRYLVHRGYRVTYVQNVTDIDDRSIAEAAARGVPFTEIVDGYFASFKRSMQRLHVLEPDREPHATAYVPEIVAMIAELVARDNAYAAPDGVYFSVASFPRYGTLSGRKTDELLIGARIAADEGKRDPLDFALWKFAKPGEPAWDSPWGAGRPGWHIECSAMSHALLGEPFDIHGGGYDLIFPHHENEIAQTESLVAPPMANVWMHGGLLQFDGKKMSKSLGNFEPLHRLLDRHEPQAIRLLFLQTGYQKPMNFTEASIDGARTGLDRLLAGYDRLRHAAAATADRAAAETAVADFRAQFYAFLDDDFNTAGAISVLFAIAAAADAAVARGTASALAGFLHEALTVVGLSPSERPAVVVHATSVKTTTVADVSYTIVRSGAERLTPEAIERLRQLVGAIVPLGALDGHETVDAVVEARILAKAQKDFALADRLRVALSGVGVTLADSKEGTSWSVGA
ncbi:MAG: cysteine--tRNA ligase [Vulcanimicrobiaceae bacterium]